MGVSFRSDHPATWEVSESASFADERAVALRKCLLMSRAVGAAPKPLSLPHRLFLCVLRIHPLCAKGP